MILKKSFCCDLRTAAQVIAFLNLVIANSVLSQECSSKLLFCFAGASRVSAVYRECDFYNVRTKQQCRSFNSNLFVGDSAILFSH